MSTLPIWSQVRLDSLAGESGLFTDGDWVLSEDLKSGDEVRLLQLGDIGVGQFLDKSSKWISRQRAGELGVTLLQPNDVLISRMAAPLARACLAPDVGYPCITAVDVAILRVDPAVANPFFVMHALNEPSFALRAEEHASGVTRKRISRKNLSALTIALPDLEEQNRLVRTLTRHLGDIARGREALSRARNALEPYRASTLRAVLSGAADALPARVQQALASAPRQKLSELADIQYGWTAKATTEAVGPRMLRITDIQDGHVDWREVPYCEVPDDKRATYLLGPGDIVFARIGATTGKSYLIDDEVPTAVFASYLIRVRPKDVLRSDFLALFFQGADYWAHIHRESRGVGRPAVNGKLLGALEVPVPPHDAQQAAVEHAQRHLTAVRTYGVVVDRNLAEVEKLELAVLVHAMTGQVSFAKRDNPHAVLAAE